MYAHQLGAYPSGLGAFPPVPSGGPAASGDIVEGEVRVVVARAPQSYDPVSVVANGTAYHVVGPLADQLRAHQQEEAYVSGLWNTSDGTTPAYGTVVMSGWRAVPVAPPNVPVEKYGTLELPGGVLRFQVREQGASDYGYSYAIIGPQLAALKKYVPAGATAWAGGTALYLTGAYDKAALSVNATSWKEDPGTVLTKEETGAPVDQHVATWTADAARDAVANRGSTWNNLSTDVPVATLEHPVIHLCTLPNGNVETVPQATGRTEKLVQYGYLPKADGSDCAKALALYQMILANESAGQKPADLPPAPDLAPYIGTPQNAGDRADASGMWKAAPEYYAPGAPLDPNKGKAAAIALAGLGLLLFIPTKKKKGHK